MRTLTDLDWPAIERKVSKFLAADPSLWAKELFYAKIKPQVIVEPFLSDDGQFPLDYKIYVFGGKPEFIQIDTDRETDHKRVFYDTKWNRQNFCYGFKLETQEIKRPLSLSKMLTFASILGRDFDFVRVDFYEISGQPYFGEMTFTPGAGLAKFDPPEMDLTLGKMWPGG